MTNFLTVEDINTVNVNDFVNEYYELYTNLIGVGEFAEVSYDFVKVSHSITSNGHVFTFRVLNKLWEGQYYIYDSEDNLVTGNTIDNVNRTITTPPIDSEYVTLGLYLCNFKNRSDSTNIRYAQRVPLFENGVYPLYKYELGDSIRIDVKKILSGDRDFDKLSRLRAGVIFQKDLYYYMVLLKKNKVRRLFGFGSHNVYVGEINHVILQVKNVFLPNGKGVDGEELDAVVIYKDSELPVRYDSEVNDYCFDIDLTEKTDDSPINVIVKFFESANILPGERKLLLKCRYRKSSSFTTLQELLTNHVKVIRLSSNIVFTGNLFINQDCLIIGDGFEVDLSEYSIIVDEDVNVTLENINFVNGNPAIVQGEGSNLKVKGSSFTGARISDVYKGSVLSTLGDENIVSSFEDVSISNCPHSIWHNGELTLNKINAVYDNIENIDTDYSMLLTMTDGILEITNSQFNINFDTNEYCSNQNSIKYAQSLLSISETAQINTILGEALKQNNALNNLFTQAYNNTSRVYCKYYYPAIEACVEDKPVLGYENKSCCHHVIGTAWVFKNNVQIERL